jgi:CubicO group peptidase (beta-lactamase class C family)
MLSARTSKIVSQILTEAGETNSDACIIYWGHECIGSMTSGQGRKFPHIMSITKLLATLGIVVAIERGLLSLEQPLADLFPEWKSGPKERINLRHVLAHVSGLQNYELPSVEIYPSADWVRLALDADLTNVPGDQWAYNNKALNLIPEVILRVSGKSIDNFLNENIFRAIGIDEFEWYSDPAGNRQGMAGACFKPEDLAKIARLLAHSGDWHNRRPLRKETLAATLMSPPHLPEKGLSFWPLIRREQLVGWEANGSLGQYLATFPDSKLSAVRIIEPERHRGKFDDFESFYPLLLNLEETLS